MHGLALLFTLHFGGDPIAARDSARAPVRDPWFSSDKAQHFFTAAFVQSLSFSGLRLTGLHRDQALVGASALTAAVGIGKEISDMKTGGDPSIKDLVWDGVGAAAAAALLERTKR